MRAVAIWINRALWTVIVTAVVVVGALVGLGRHYIQYVDAYQTAIVDIIKQRTGLQLQVQQLDASWVRASPQFTLNHLKIFNPAKPDEVVFAIDRLVVRVGLLQSLANLTPVFSMVEGRGALAQLDEVQPGQWQLRGFPSGGSIDPLIDNLLRIHRAEISASQAQLHFIGGRSAQLDAQSVQLQRAGNFRRLRLALQVAEDGAAFNQAGAALHQPGAPLKVVLEATGDPRQRDHFSARGYAEFAKVDLTPLLPLARSYGFDLKHGRIDGAAWLDWRDGALSVRGDIALPVLDLAGITARDLPPVKKISAPFLLNSRAGRQQLWLPRVRAEWGQETIDIASLLIERDIATPVFTVSLPQLSLDVLHRTLRAGNILPESLATVLDDLAPSGELRNLQMQLPMTPEHRDQLRVRAEIAALKISAWHGAPGLVGINGFFDTGIDGGSAVLDGIDAQLDFPHVYHQPIPFDRIRGALDWRREGERILVESGPISAVSAAGTASILLGLNLNIKPQDVVPPQMTLMVGMRNSAAQYRNLFVPYTLPPNLLAWLDHSIGPAQLPRGGFIYHGSLRAGDHTHRSVQLFLDVNDGELRYHADWPALHNLNAQVWLDDAELDVRGRGARIFDQVALTDIDVAMRPLPQGGQWLTVTGRADVRDNDLLRLLRESPVQNNLSGALDSWQWSGIANAQLALGIPIGGDHALAPDISVDAALNAGTLQLLNLNLTLTDVSGPLQYRSQSVAKKMAGEKHGLSSVGLNAKLYDRATKVRLSSDEHNVIDIRASGKMAMVDLRNWLQQPLLDYAQGETPFKLDVKLNGDHSTLHANSDLAGIEINLPVPYHKNADAILPLTVAMALRGNRHTTITAGDWADLNLFWKVQSDADTRSSGAGEKPTLQSGVLRLGVTGDTTPEPGRLVVTGTVPPVDLDVWRAQFGGKRGEVGSVLAVVADDSAPAAAMPALTVSLRDLYLPEVTTGITLHDVRISGQHRADTGLAPGWSLHIHADKLSGSATIPDNSELPLQLDFARLQLPAPPPTTPEPGAAPAPSVLAQMDPAGVPAADVKIRQLWRGDENWGEVDFKLRPIANGLRLGHLQGNLRGIAVQPVGAVPATLTWQRRGDVHTTRFVGRLAVDDIADVLARWHFEKSITSRSGTIETDVSWIGAPDEIGLKKLDGVATVGLHDGQFLKAGSATGALKVVGVFNFANLLRRLQLDFSDLFRDGVSFDTIEGQLAMSNGVFSAKTPLEINSPSSHFRLSGQIDFTTDLAAMELVATLPVASNLPWVVALAGGLPAAAGVYVASKLFEEQVDHFSSAVYEIRGPWRDPQVKFRRIFDDQLPQAPPASTAAQAVPAERQPTEQPLMARPEEEQAP